MNYGEFGGQYVPQELKEKLNEIEEEFEKAKNDDNFKKEYLYYLNQYVGRPSPLYFAKNLSDYSKGAKIYLKREDLNHTGSHKINNALGQILLAKRMNKTHIIAETGAGSHGTAVATVCSLFNMKCSIFMGKEDIKRQMPNVERMKILGAEVIEVKEGKGTLKEAVDAAFNYLLENQDVFYLVGSCVGPSPYPKMVKYFQKIIGEEAKEQILNQEGKLPKAIIACIGGGSNSIGLFTDFIKEKNVDIYGIEAAGKGLNTNQHASAIYNNKIGVLHGMKTYIMQDENGDIREAYSISAGLDYPGIGPEHAYLKSIGRVKYDSITDKEAIESFKLLCRLEGIIPALESSHAIAYAVKIAKNYSKDDSIIVNLSGRGDKDLFTILNI
ncbi:MAG: tryptophan synthase subunit beta [Clostridia bacterium]|nr:tryptophan synthase subunit beta [Clostridia bacterium]HCF65258.1 tryptophan synthase subunit beta [Clostridiales bacterium]